MLPDPEKSIPATKPGWMARIFGIETARLIACDARWTGDVWERTVPFAFLFRSRRGKFFELTSEDSWSVLRADEARALWDRLPVKLASEDEAFKHVEIPPVARSRDEEEDTRAYKVVRNDKWEFSIWPDERDLPRGWHFIGISGRQHDCLEFIEQNCVFGAPNPGLP